MFDKWSRLGVWFGVGLGFVAAARTSAAAPQNLTDVVHFSLDGSLLSYQKLKLTADQPADPSAAAPDTTHTSSTTFGLLGSGFGIGFGYGITDSLLIGTQLGLVSTKLSDPTGDGTVTEIEFLPRLEYLFDGTDARPFLAAILGFGHDSTSVPVQGSDASTVSGTQFLFGASFGVHAFLSDTLSIDPALTFLGSSGSQTSTIGDITVDGTTLPGSSEHGSTSGYQFVLSLGLSGWLGAAPTPAAPAEPSAAPAVATAPAPTAPEEEPLSASIGFADHRELSVRIAADPNLPSVVVHLYVPEDDPALTNCTDIRVMDGDTPLALRVTSRGDKPHGTRSRHFVAGVLPVHALTLLARAGSALSVCDQAWPLSPKARHEIHAFLSARHELTTHDTEPLEPEAPSDAPPPATPSAADATPASAAPSPNPAAPAPAVPAK